jgi:ribosomal protein S12 methylthiotransferase accessory factor
MEIYFPGKKKVDVAAGQFVIHTDQTTAHGGDGTAPEPFTLFLASMGACAGVYVLGFCQARGIPTDDIRLEQNAEFDEKGALAKVTIDINLPATFPQKYLAAVQAAAEKCAVKRAFEAHPAIDVRTVQAKAEVRA